MRDRRAISASTKTYQNKQHRTSLDYRGISIASFRLSATDTYFNTGDDPNAFDRRTIPAEHGVAPRARFIGLGITGDVVCTWRVPITNFSLAISSLANFPRKRERERKIEKKKGKREARESVARIHISISRDVAVEDDECAGCASSWASIMKFILWFPAGHFGKLSGISSPRARPRAP